MYHDAMLPMALHPAPGPARLDHPTRRTAMLPHPDSTHMEDDDNFDDDNDDVDVNVSVVSLSLSVCVSPCLSVSPYLQRHMHNILPVVPGRNFQGY